MNTSLCVLTQSALYFKLNCWPGCTLARLACSKVPYIHSRWKNPPQFPFDGFKIVTVPFWFHQNTLQSFSPSIRSQITYQTQVWLPLCRFCIVVTHVTTLSLCRQRETSAGGEFPCRWRWCCGEVETTHQSQTDNDWSSWLPYRASVKPSFVGAAFLRIVPPFALRNYSTLISCISYNSVMRSGSDDHIFYGGRVLSSDCGCFWK